MQQLCKTLKVDDWELYARFRCCIWIEYGIDFVWKFNANFACLLSIFSKNFKLVTNKGSSLRKWSYQKGTKLLQHCLFTTKTFFRQWLACETTETRRNNRLSPIQPPVPEPATSTFKWVTNSPPFAANSISGRETSTWRLIAYNQLIGTLNDKKTKSKKISHIFSSSDFKRHL